LSNTIHFLGLIHVELAHSVLAIDCSLSAGLMTVTLKDVAQAARVSVSTASRALTGTGLTSERTQQRLTRIARELGYRPNPIARGLKTGQSRLVALLVHNLTNASFQVMAEVVQARLKALSYQMLLCIGRRSAAGERHPHHAGRPSHRRADRRPHRQERPAAQGAGEGCSDRLPGAAR